MPDGDVLRIEPGAAKRMAAAFDRHADVLAATADALRRHEFATGFAGFPSAIELDAGFQGKRHQAIAHLQQQEQTTREYADSIRIAGANYREADSNAGRSIDAAGAENGLG